MSRRQQFLATISLACLMGITSALAASQAAVAATPITGQFPIEAHIAALEPESTVCGFPVRVDLTGQGTFRSFSTNWVTQPAQTSSSTAPER
jgi:hypothetical protein